MPAPYSDDFREKAVAAVDRGEKKSHVCRMLNISRNTLNLWLKAREERGSVGAKRNYRRGPLPKIPDLENFRAFARENGHLTQEGMAQRWKERISGVTIGKALKRLGFTRKKKLTGTGKGTRKSGLNFSNLSVTAPDKDSFI
jgi:transposase